MAGWRWLMSVSSVVLAASACARANPAFDAENSATDAVATGADGGETRGSVTSPGDDGTPASSADGSADGTKGGPASEGGVEPATSDDDGLPPDVGVTDCVYEPAFTPFTIDVIDEFGDVIDLPCGRVRTLVGPIQDAGTGQYTLVDCSGCDACPQAPTTVMLHGADLPELPASLVPVCARIEIAIGPAAEGCLPESMTMADAFGAMSAPEVIVTNLRAPPRLAALVPPEPDLLDRACDQACQNDFVPGEYGLQFDNGQTIEPGAPVSGIAMQPLDPGVVAQYDVLLRHAAIDGACVEHFGWTAVQTPG